MIHDPFYLVLVPVVVAAAVTVARAIRMAWFS